MIENYQEKKVVQKEYYNRTAFKYDAWHIETASAKIVDQWNFTNLKNFLVQPKVNRCLDLACGTGRLTHKLLQIADEVYGLDLSEEVLEIARTKYPQVHWQLGEVVHLPYEDNFFDLVVINGSLHHFFAMNQTLQQINRVLKPGGRLVVLGEPNKNYNALWNPFFYLWVIVRLCVRFFNLFIKQKSVKPEEIEPEAEVFMPTEIKASLLENNFIIDSFYTYDYLPRLEAKIFIRCYGKYLIWEHRYLAKIFPSLGSAIQFCASKK